MARVRSFRTIRPFIWIPPTYSALYKIEITRSSGATDDITDVIYEGEVLDGVTDTIGSFSFLIDNSSETYTGVWTGNEIIRIYINYATSATTARFRGRIEKVSYQDNKIKIIGRSESAKLLDITVTRSYSNIETSVILKALFDAYATDFTYTNINTSTTSITVNWYQKSFWECVQELCHSASFDCYIDASLDCHYFESKTINNANECVVHESNLIEVGDFAYDQSLVKNKVIVYGVDIGNMPLIYTAEDETSQTRYGLKELIIKDENITTRTQAKERADYELARSKDSPLIGEVVTLGLATIQPGERIRISAPYSNLNPNYYQILSYKHEFNGFMKTILNIEKESKKIYHIIKDRISTEKKLTETPNPNEMGYSYIWDFNSDSGTHSDTEITDGVLKTTSGNSTGTWISELVELEDQFTAIESRIRGSSLAGMKVFLSIDGRSYQQIGGLGAVSQTIVTGIDLRVKIEIYSENTQIDSFGILYKT